MSLKNHKKVLVITQIKKYIHNNQIIKKVQTLIIYNNKMIFFNYFVKKPKMRVQIVFRKNKNKFKNRK